MKREDYEFIIDLFQILLLEAFYDWLVIWRGFDGFLMYFDFRIEELQWFFLLLSLYGFLVMIHFWNKGVLWNDFGLVLWHVFGTRLNYDLKLLKSYIRDFVLFTYKVVYI